MPWPPTAILAVVDVKMINRYGTRKCTLGILYITATHLIFVDPNGKKETWVLHLHIAAIDKLPLTHDGSPIQIRCSNFLYLHFVIPRDRDCVDVVSSLEALHQPSNLNDLYAFHYISGEITEHSIGWDDYDLSSEYLRMGVSGCNWVLSSINQNYEICDTYPSHLYMPVGVPTPVLLGSARFRSKGRLPTLSYLHASNMAALCRSSQPLAGFSARCMEDERLLQAICKANPNSEYLYVIDTRPKINAMVNRAAGKGYESENFYANIKFQFIGIENIHVMRASLQKLVEISETKNVSMSGFLNDLESCGWLKHIKSVMDTSVFIARTIKDGTSVLVHCSDGWDRTAQTCSIACLLLDPFYRTFHGFLTLIEKEWLSFGHKFIDRCGYLNTIDHNELSPIFTQFLDAVWQLTNQYPAKFEFNELFLLTLHDHLFSCQFGTFIGNCEKDRIDLRLKERTFSLWAWLKLNKTDYMNPFFSKIAQLQIHLIPSTAPQCFKFWSGLYCRYDNMVHTREKIHNVICSLKSHTESLTDHSALLDKRLTEISSILNKDDVQLLNSLSTMSASESIDFNKLLLDGRKSRPNHLKAAKRNTDLQSLTVQQLAAELQSVSIDWKILRSASHCSCSIPFENYNKKHHCWHCGGIHCGRCLARSVLHGQLSGLTRPVCKPCFKQIECLNL